MFNSNFNSLLWTCRVVLNSSTSKFQQDFLVQTSKNRGGKNCWNSNLQENVSFAYWFPENAVEIWWKLRKLSALLVFANVTDRHKTKFLAEARKLEIWVHIWGAHFFLLLCSSVCAYKIPNEGCTCRYLITRSFHVRDRRIFFVQISFQVF